MIGTDSYICKMFNNSILCFQSRRSACDKCDTFEFLEVHRGATEDTEDYRHGWTQMNTDKSDHICVDLRSEELD